MTILPGSLDYLYYNGILDHIPYEAYELGPITPSGIEEMNGTQYLQAAQKGRIYNTYTAPDMFIRRDDENFKEGENYSIWEKSYSDGDGINNGQNSAKGFFAKVKDTVVCSPAWAKGIVAGGVVLTTLCCLLRKLFTKK